MEAAWRAVGVLLCQALGFPYPLSPGSLWCTSSHAAFRAKEGDIPQHVRPWLLPKQATIPKYTPMATAQGAGR